MKLLIRTDADAQMGTGHLMRCLALAQAWLDAGQEACFVMTMESSGLEARLRAEGMQFVRISERGGSLADAQETTALARRETAAWVVVDGYHFGADYWAQLKAGGLRLLVIDDRGHVPCSHVDLVLNQNLYADEALYPDRASETRLLCGTRYVLLRREFLQWRGWQREIPEVARKILVTFGGGNVEPVALSVLHALQQLERHDLDVKVVVGPMNTSATVLQQVAGRCSFTVQVVSVGVEMPEVMAWADIAISAGGTTCWETAFMGLPNYLIPLVEHQEEVAKVLQREDAAIDGGPAGAVEDVRVVQGLDQLMANRDRRRRLSKQGRRLVDGGGSQRVVEVLRRLVEHR